MEIGKRNPLEMQEKWIGPGFAQRANGSESEHAVPVVRRKCFENPLSQAENTILGTVLTLLKTIQSVHLS